METGAPWPEAPFSKSHGYVSDHGHHQTTTASIGPFGYSLQAIADSAGPLTAGANSSVRHSFQPTAGSAGHGDISTVRHSFQPTAGLAGHGLRPTTDSTGHDSSRLQCRWTWLSVGSRFRWARSGRQRDLSAQIDTEISARLDTVSGRQQDL